MTNVWIILLIVGIGTTVARTAALLALDLPNRDIVSKHTIRLDILGIIVGLIIATVSGFYLAKNNNDKIKEAELKIENGANVYIDGQEVNGDKLILRDYHIKFKGNDVILSPKW